MSEGKFTDTLRSGRKELYQSTALTFDCVRLLQERLDDAAQAVSDETLVAVSQLIALEVRHASYITTDMTDLYRMTPET